MTLKSMAAPGPLLGTHQALPREGSKPTGDQHVQGRQGDAGIYRVSTGRFSEGSEGS